MKSTDEIIAKISQLKDLISDFAPTHPVFRHDWYLVHYLRVRNWNVDKAEALVRKSLEWRQQASVEAALSNEILSQCKIQFSPCTDGISSCIFCDILSTNIKALIKTFGKDKIIRSMSFGMEQAERRFIDGVNEKFSLYEEKIRFEAIGMTIGDLANLSFGVLSVDVADVFMGIGKLTSEIYPAVFKSFRLVNAGRWGYLITRILSPVLAQPGKEFISYSPDDQAWKPMLHHVLGPKALPACYE